MKKITRILLLSFVLLLAVPTYAKADPPGYKVVKLTKKNIKKYFTIKSFKCYPAHGDYAICLYSKLRKKGYFVYDTIGLKVKVTFTEKYKSSYYTVKRTITDYDADSGMVILLSDGSYKKSKIKNIKFTKVKGKVIFVKPDNVIGFEHDYWGHEIKLKYPFDSMTLGRTHWGYVNGVYDEIFDNYCIERASVWLDDFYVY